VVMAGAAAGGVAVVALVSMMNLCFQSTYASVPQQARPARMWRNIFRKGHCAALHQLSTHPANPLLSPSPLALFLAKAAAQDYV